MMMMTSKDFFRCLWCITTIITYTNLTLFQGLNTVVYQEFESYLQPHIVSNNVPSLTQYATVEAADTKTHSNTVTKPLHAHTNKDSTLIPQHLSSPRHSSQTSCAVQPSDSNSSQK
jgi:hypothetical protein